MCPPPSRPAAHPVVDAPFGLAKRVALVAKRSNIFPVPPPLVEVEQKRPAYAVVPTPESVHQLAVLPPAPALPLPVLRHRSIGAGPVLLARFRLPCPHRLLRLDPSLVSQIDGLCFSLCRMRLERDVLADSLEAAYCPIFGRASFESASSFDGFYFGDPRDVEAALRSAVEEHGRGVFVVVDPGRALRPEWQATLFSHARLQFVLPVGSMGAPATSRVVAVLANFGKFKWKSKRRPERSLDVVIQPELSKRVKLQAQPVLVTRVSPIAHNQLSVLADDRATGGAPSTDVSTVTQRRAPQWNVGTIRRWARDFPCPAVAQFAIEAASVGIDSFVGTSLKLCGSRRLRRLQRSLRSVASRC